MPTSRVSSNRRMTHLKKPKKKATSTGGGIRRLHTSPTDSHLALENHVRARHSEDKTSSRRQLSVCPNIISTQEKEPRMTLQTTTEWAKEHFGLKMKRPTGYTIYTIKGVASKGKGVSVIVEREDGWCTTISRQDALSLIPID